MNDEKELSGKIEYYGDSAEYEFHLVDVGVSWRSYCVYYSQTKRTIEFHAHYYPKKYGNSDMSTENGPLLFDLCSSEDIDEIKKAFGYFMSRFRGHLRHKDQYD